MTKLDWTKAKRFEADPGSVVEVPDNSRPSRIRESKAQREKAERKLLERSELRRQGDLLRRKRRLADPDLLQKACAQLTEIERVARKAQQTFIADKLSKVIALLRP